MEVQFRFELRCIEAPVYTVDFDVKDHIQIPRDTKKEKKNINILFSRSLQVKMGNVFFVCFVQHFW